MRKTRELKFSITISEMAISRLTISRPLGLRTLRLRLFLLTFVSLKLPEVFRLTSRSCGVVVLGSRPRSFSGHSILMISAPSAPSQRVAHGPARTQLKSTTRMPSSARGRDMACAPVSLAVLACYGRRLGEECLIPLHPFQPAFFCIYDCRVSSGHQWFSFCDDRHFRLS